jgi:hypothetical protein
MPTYRIEDSPAVTESYRGCEKNLARSPCSLERRKKLPRSLEVTSGPRGSLISSEQGYQICPPIPLKNVPKSVAIFHDCYWIRDTFIMIGFVEVS